MKKFSISYALAFAFAVIFAFSPLAAVEITEKAEKVWNDFKWNVKRIVTGAHNDAATLGYKIKDKAGQVGLGIKNWCEQTYNQVTVDALKDKARKAFKNFGSTMGNIDQEVAAFQKEHKLTSHSETKK